MNDVTLITRTLHIKRELLAMIAESLWNRYPATLTVSKYDPLYEVSLAKFIKMAIQGFYPDATFDYLNATEYKRYHAAAIYNLYEKAKK